MANHCSVPTRTEWEKIANVRPDGLSIEEIAQRLNISHQRVSQLLRSGMKKLIAAAGRGEILPPEDIVDA